MTLIEYLLICLMEECSEVQHVAAKTLRFGINDIKPRTSVSNYKELVNEFNDIIAITELLKSEGVNIYKDEERIKLKKERLIKYMQNSVDNGVLQCLPNKT